VWDKIQAITYVMLVAVAAWLFAATYEPLCSRAFGRPLSRRQAVVGRMIAGLCIVCSLAVLLTDLLLR
jgi:hypothetical protein